MEVEEIEHDEIPEELKESGAIAVKLKDVRNSIGKDRAQWKLALEAELNSLRETGPTHEVNHVPKGVQVLPMKVVLTLKPDPEMRTKKKRQEHVCANSHEKNQRIYFTQRILIFRQSEWFYPWPHNMEVGELELWMLEQLL